MHPCRSGPVRCSFPPSMGMPPGSLFRRSRLRSEGDISWQAWDRASRAAVNRPIAFCSPTHGGEGNPIAYTGSPVPPFPHTRGRGAAQVAGAAQRPPLPHTLGEAAAQAWKEHGAAYGVVPPARGGVVHNSLSPRHRSPSGGNLPMAAPCLFNTGMEGKSVLVDIRAK